MITWIIILPLFLTILLMILPSQKGKLMMAITWNCVLVTYLLGLYLMMQYYQAAICGDIFSFIELEITLLNGALLAGMDGISIWLIWLTVVSCY